MGIPSLRWVDRRIALFAFASVATLGLLVVIPAIVESQDVGTEFEEFHSKTGGTMIIGYALSPRIIEDGRITQYFERQRLELHEENEPPYDVLLGRLGEEEARRRGLKETEAFAPIGSAEEADPGCAYFEETGHQACAGFQQFWEGNGLDLGDPGVSERESLALFGYPISREFIDPNTGLTIQYFERARFEYRPDKAGTPYEVMLGRVGAPIWADKQHSAEMAPEPEPEPEVVVLAEQEPEQEHETAPGAGSAVGTFLWPTEGVLTQGFGNTAWAQGGAYNGAGHTGIDIANNMNTPIHASDGGTVVQSGWLGGYGFAVVVDHGNGFQTLYGHMAEHPPVWPGQAVAQGEYLGPMGSTGYSTGPHLHFEVLRDGQPQDPIAFLN